MPSQTPLTFNDATRNQRYPLTSQSRVAGGGNIVSWDLPRTGILARIYLVIRGTINALTGTPNVLGQSAIIRRVRLASNLGIDIFNVTGPGYFFLVAPYLDFPGLPLQGSTAKAAIASAAAPILDMIIPIAVNLRDMTGLMMLQSEQTLLTLTVEFETDAVLAPSGLTWTTQPSVVPQLEIFSVPPTANLLPPLNMIHSIIEDQTAVAASGAFTYSWPRGNTYLQLIHGLGFQVTTPADGWSQALLRINYTDTVYNEVPTAMDTINSFQRYQARALGVIPWDLVSSSGLGVYDLLRDTINSAYYTQIDSYITATGAGTLYSVRRQLVPLVG